MYEAKSFILKLLKMSITRNRLVKDLKKGLLEKTKDRLFQVRKLNSRIESQIQTLQQEHRIFKRPFILNGRDYLQGIKQDLFDLESTFQDQHFIDESGTTGTLYDWLTLNHFNY